MCCKYSLQAIFKSQLMELKENLLSSSPHFIRTIKSNHQKKPGIFDQELIKRQLKYTGILETTRIRGEGYSLRPKFDDFVIIQDHINGVNTRCS